MGSTSGIIEITNARKTININSRIVLGLVILCNLEWQYTTEINGKNEFGLSHTKNIHVALTKTITIKISVKIADSKKAKRTKR